MINNSGYITGKVSIILSKLTDAERESALNAIVQNIPAAATAATAYDAQNACCNPNGNFAAFRADFANLSDEQKMMLGMNAGWLAYLQALAIGTP